MIAQVIQILTTEGQRMTDEIRSKTPKVTGKMSNSLAYEVSQTPTQATLKITARPYFRVVETGRRPTPDKKPSRKMIENLKEWLQALGKEQSLAWAIATNINKKGTKLWRDGGRKDIFSDVLSDRKIAKLERSLLDVIADYTLSTFLKDLERNKLVK
jgi:hypothetical protein